MRCTSGNEAGPNFEFCSNEYWEYVLKDNRHHVSFNSDGNNDNVADQNAPNT